MSTDEGPYALADAVIDQMYDVDLAAGEFGGIPGVGGHVEGDIPPGLEATQTLHLTGVPVVLGRFEVSIVSVAHWVPPGCPGVTYRTAFTITVLDGASTTTDHDAGSTSSNGAKG